MATIIIWSVNQVQKNENILISCRKSIRFIILTSFFWCVTIIQEKKNHRKLNLFNVWQSVNQARLLMFADEVRDPDPPVYEPYKEKFYIRIDLNYTTSWNFMFLLSFLEINWKNTRNPTNYCLVNKTAWLINFFYSVGPFF